MNRFFAPGGEFARIERLFGPAHFARDGRGLGDDGFVWEPGAGETWVAASDASVEGVHYRFDWVSPARALRKALLANLSDINAMGGRTRFVLFNLGARRDWNAAVYDALGAGLRALEQAHGFRVAGGDTTSQQDASFFSFAVFGVVAGAPLLRSAVRPGHRLYVSGSLGGSSAGLAALRSESVPPSVYSAVVDAHLDPSPPLGLGPLLATMQDAGRSVAAIDISDGLSSELWHLARQSACALRVDPRALPRHAALASCSDEEALAHALHGGEEYQLLFSGNFTADELALMRSLCPVTEIGEAVEGDGVFLRDNDIMKPLVAGGFSHGVDSP